MGEPDTDGAGYPFETPHPRHFAATVYSEWFRRTWYGRVVIFPCWLLWPFGAIFIGLFHYFERLARWWDAREPAVYRGEDR